MESGDQIEFDEVVGSLESEGYEIPESMKRYETELRILHYTTSEAVQQFEMTEIDKKEMVYHFNKGLEFIDQSMPENGYHDKQHPLAFAMNMACQMLVMKRDQGDTSLGDDITPEMFYIITELAMRHDGSEKDPGVSREKHEITEVERIEDGFVEVIEGVTIDHGIKNADGKENELAKKIARPLLLATQYPIPNKRENVNSMETVTQMVESGELPSVYIELAKRFAAGDYLEMFGRKSYFSPDWFRLVGIPFGDNAIQELPGSTNAAEAFVATKDYELAMLWVEQILLPDGHMFVANADLLSYVASTDFSKDALSTHESSLRAIQNSHLPEWIKDRFSPKIDLFPERQLMQYFKDNPNEIGKVARFFLRFNKEVTVERTEEIVNRAISTETWVQSQVTLFIENSSDSNDVNGEEDVLRNLRTQVQRMKFEDVDELTIWQTVRTNRVFVIWAKSNMSQVDERT